VGGSEIEAQQVCAALIERGYQVQVVCAGGGPMPRLRDWIDPMGVPVRIYGHRWGEGPARDVIFALGVAWTLFQRRRHTHLVYFLMQGFHVAVGLPVARLLGKPIVMKIAGSGVIDLLRHRSRLGKIELEWLRKWGYRLMVLNEGMVEEALAAGFTRDQLLWMPNPVDSDQFSPASPEQRAALRARFHIPADARVLLYVGRLAPEKALPDLLAGFAKAAAADPRARLIFAGDGPLRETLECQARQLGLADRVRFPGRIDPNHIPDWLRAADLFALVSPGEGFSCALVEAMSAGLAAIVSDIPANTQLVSHGVNGLTVPVGDPDAIASAITLLFEDEARRHRMGEASRQIVVENYATARVIDRYEELFQGAVAAHARQ
jgi:glycosyltransferase involved in cell wall biosynthesis